MVEGCRPLVLPSPEPLVHQQEVPAHYSDVGFSGLSKSIREPSIGAGPESKRLGMKLLGACSAPGTGRPRAPFPLTLSLVTQPI